MNEEAELVRMERDGDVAVLTLNRPEKLNAISTAVEETLVRMLASAEVSSSRVIVFAGAGRAFSAGADVIEFADLNWSDRSIDSFSRGLLKQIHQFF